MLFACRSCMCFIGATLKENNNSIIYIAVEIRVVSVYTTISGKSLQALYDSTIKRTGEAITEAHAPHLVIVMQMCMPAPTAQQK